MRVKCTSWRILRNVDVSFSEPGVSLVTGRNDVADYADTNGSGKTSLINLITWVLYGDHPGMSSAKSVIYNKGEKGAKADGEVWIHVKMGVLYVKRERTRSGVKVWTWLGDTAEQVGPQLRDADVAQQLILEALGVSYQRWVKLLMYDGSYKLASLGDAALKTLLVSLLPVDVTTSEKGAKAKLEESKQELTRVEGSINAITHQLVGVDAQRTESGERVRQWEADKAKNLPAFEQIAEQQETELAGLRQALALSEAELARQRTDATGAISQEISGYNNLLPGMRSEVQRIDRALADAQFTLAIEMPRTTCHTCAQPLPHEAVSYAQEAWRTSYEAAKASEAQLTVDRGTAQGTLDNMLALKQGAEERLRQAQASLPKLDQDVAVMRANVAKCEHELQTTRDNVAIWRNTVNPHAAAYANAEAQSAQLNQQLTELGQQEQAARGPIAFWKYVAKLCGKKGLMHFALEQMLPRLTMDASELMAYVSPEHLKLEFSAAKGKSEKFHINASSEVGASTYPELSDGEQRRIDAAVHLAMFQHVTRSTIPLTVVALDELLDSSLDSRGRETLIVGLTELAKAKGLHIILITNQTDVVNDFRRVARVMTVHRTPEGAELKIA